jgi:predicted TIM-barrel fold metal-dependent hydrolase
MLVIDSHTHMFPPQVREHPSDIEEEELPFSLMFGHSKSRMADPETMLQDMDSSGVDMAVLCPFPWNSLERCCLNNDYLLDLASSHPHRFLAMAITNPRYGERALKEARRCLEAGASGLGELHSLPQGFDPADEKLMSPLVDLVREFDVPLLMHVNEPLGHFYPGKGPVTPGEIYRFIEAFPEVKLILPHWGGGLPFYELMPEVAELCANVYYDTAASPYLYRSEIYRLAAEAAGAHKILFATDYPLLPYPRTLDDARTGIARGDLERAILGGNAAGLFDVDMQE